MPKIKDCLSICQQRKMKRLMVSLYNYKQITLLTNETQNWGIKVNNSVQSATKNFQGVQSINNIGY
ncbi:unnamed protein product [Trifolium pratense]|uniref:Uncharacterized protein n=1 Tax=Trifolium pratense TaxID=57577 RepID=A0ACB0KDH7_TRIPR|nr:unnamed protein product [Trifolium pratense]